MGHGLERGLFNLQQGIIQSGLQGERDAMEQRRLQLTFAHDEARDTARMAHEDVRDDKRLAAERGMKQEEMGSRVLLDSINRQSASDLQEKKIASEKEMHQETLGTRIVEKGMDIDEKTKELAAKTLADEDERRVKREDIGMRKSYYDALINKAKQGTGTKADWEGAKMYGRLLDAQVSAMVSSHEKMKADPMYATMPLKEKQEIEKDFAKRLNQIKTEARSLINLGSTLPPLESGGPITIRDPDDLEP